MLTIVAPATVQRAALVCVTIGGAQGAVTATLEVEGVMITLHRQSNPDGSFVYCARLPRTFKGVAYVHATSGRDYGLTAIVVQ